jgi:hypothetical protein
MAIAAKLKGDQAAENGRIPWKQRPDMAGDGTRWYDTGLWALLWEFGRLMSAPDKEELQRPIDAPPPSTLQKIGNKARQALNGLGTAADGSARGSCIAIDTILGDWSPDFVKADAARAAEGLHPSTVAAVRIMGVIAREAMINIAANGLGRLLGPLVGRLGQALGLTAGEARGLGLVLASANAVRQLDGFLTNFKEGLDALDRGDNEAAAAAFSRAAINGIGFLDSVGQVWKGLKQCCCQCFPPDTLVATETGLRPIAKIEAGDRVWTYDFQGGAWRLCEVEWRHDSDYFGPIVTLDAAVGEVTATAWHPFWVVEGEDLESRPACRHLDSNEDRGQSLRGRWVNSHDLREGDVVFLRDAGPVAIRRVCQHDKLTPVCNLTIRGLHAFAVGEGQLLVHNTSGSENTPKWVWREYMSMKENYRILRDPNAPEWRKDLAIQYLKESFERFRAYYGNPDWQPPNCIVGP